MEKEIIIRDVKINDFDQVHRLLMQVHILHAKERSDIYKDTDPLTIEEFKKEILNEHNIYLVAEFENEIVGICFSKIKDVLNNSIMKDRRILHIEDICVDENKRKKGIGRKLYNELKKRAKEIKADSIELMVWKFNVDAIKFYENLGMNIKNLKFEQKIR